MRRLLLLTLALSLLGLVWLGPTASGNSQKYPPMGTIERLDPAFNKLIPTSSVLEQLAGGFEWTEGPVWVNKDGGYLLFSDIPNNRIVKWQDGKGVADFLKPVCRNSANLKEPGSNGLLLDPQGRLVMMEHGDRRVARLDADGKQTVLADKFEGKRFNIPNDGVYKSNGDLYFTDPPYGLMRKDQEGFPGMEMDFCGVYRLAKDGKLTLLTKSMTKPNGIAFSPDEKTLYVANSDPDKAVWMAFPVKDDGTLGEGKVFFDSTPWVKMKKPGLPDGMKVDKDGNVFATGPGGLHVFTPQGKLLGTLATGVPTANCGWGDDGSVLYVCADKHICRIKTATKGKGF